MNIFKVQRCPRGHRRSPLQFTHVHVSFAEMMQKRKPLMDNKLTFSRSHNRPDTLALSSAGSLSTCGSALSQRNPSGGPAEWCRGTQGTAACVSTATATISHRHHRAPANRWPSPGPCGSVMVSGCDGNLRPDWI